MRKNPLILRGSLACLSVAAITLSSPAYGASIVFSAPVTVTDEADLDTPMALFPVVEHAGRWGGGNVTVATPGGQFILFEDRLPTGGFVATDEARITNGGGEATDPAMFNATGTSVNVDFGVVLDGLAFDAAGALQLTVTGNSGTALVIGQQYQIQVFVSDDRTINTPPINTRTVRLQDTSGGTGNNSATFAVGTSPYVLGTFTADAATQNIFINGVAQTQENVNAYVLRTVPEPTSALLLASGAIGLLSVRRRRS